MTEVSVRQTYRIRPSSSAERYLIREYGMCRFIWNALTAQSKRLHENDPDGTFGYKSQDRYLTELRATTQNEDGEFWLREGSSVVQQQTVRDFSAARAKALLDRKNRLPMSRRRGLPRFKKRDRSSPSLAYTRRGFSLVDQGGVIRLRLPRGVVIPVVWSTDVPMDASSVRVYRDSLGHWYASFVTVRDLSESVLAENGRSIGIDWGVSQTATTVSAEIDGALDESDAHDLPSHGYRKRAQDAIAREQRKMARRKTARGTANSNGYARAKRASARAEKRASRQSQDNAHKWSKQVVRSHGQIAVEDFTPKFLAKTRMARKSFDNSIGIVKAALAWQARKHGRHLVLVPPAHTTMDCSRCLARAKQRIPLDVRVYSCATCGMSKSRDKNSAIIMMLRAGFIPAGIDGVRRLTSAAGLALPEPGIPRL